MDSTPNPDRSEADAAGAAVAADSRPATGTLDSRRWTGDADEQKAELKTHLIGFAIAVALMAPIAVWLGRAACRAIGL